MPLSVASCLPIFQRPRTAAGAGSAIHRHHHHRRVIVTPAADAPPPAISTEDTEVAPGEGEHCGANGEHHRFLASIALAGCRRQRPGDLAESTAVVVA